MTYALITPPVAEPVTLADLKAHLRLDGDDEDGYLTGLIAVARDHLERTTGLALLTQTWRLYRDAWPEGGILTLDRGPVRALDAIRTYDELGEEEVVPLATAMLDAASLPARLYLKVLPAPGQALNGIEVDFTSGFGDAGTDVPDGLKRAIILHAAHMFEFRTAVPLDQQPASVPGGYDRLLAPFLPRRL
jgi:uncharacterized phiE125 gp8 family phage protein